MRVALIVNPNARRGSGAATQIREELRARGVELAEPGPPGGERKPIDAIVVGGGDGTIANVIGNALQFDVPIGVIPLGTFNELARTLGIPLDLAGACDAIAHGRPRSIDVAQVNGHYYLSEASIGVSSRLARMQTTNEKRRFGLWAILKSALSALRYAQPIGVTVGFNSHHETFKTVQLTVANSHRFGGVVHVSDAAIDDGWLDLFSVEIANVAQAFGLAHALHLGKRKDVPGLRTYRAATFEIATRRPHRISADGEPAGTTPARFTLAPKALRVLVPE